jgi:hypothetical protein
MFKYIETCSSFGKHTLNQIHLGVFTIVLYIFLVVFHSLLREGSVVFFLGFCPSIRSPSCNEVDISCLVGTSYSFTLFMSSCSSARLSFNDKGFPKAESKIGDEQGNVLDTLSALLKG